MTTTSKPEPCPHYEQMAEYLKDAAVHPEPWTLWQWRMENESDNCLTTLRGHPLWEPDRVFVRKPRTITVNGVEVPEPLRYAPEDKTWCWLTQLHNHNKAILVLWEGSDADYIWLRRGLLHATEENALTHAKALLLPSEIEE